MREETNSSKERLCEGRVQLHCARRMRSIFLRSMLHVKHRLYIRIKWQTLVYIHHASKSVFIHFKTEFLHSTDFVWKHSRSLKYLEFLRQGYMTYCQIWNCPVKVALTHKGGKWIKMNSPRAGHFQQAETSPVQSIISCPFITMLPMKQFAH